MEQPNIGKPERADVRQVTKSHEGWISRGYSVWAKNNPELADRLGRVVLRAMGAQPFLDAFDEELNLATRAIRGRIE